MFFFENPHIVVISANMSQSHKYSNKYLQQVITRHNATLKLAVFQAPLESSQFWQSQDLGSACYGNCSLSGILQLFPFYGKAFYNDSPTFAGLL